MNHSKRIGFMQGRLSPLVGGKIQAFPASCWQEEFRNAQKLGFELMEWTLDQDKLYDNPLLTSAGQAEILELRSTCGVTVLSLTGDCFMQSPFWKAEGSERASLLQDFRAVAKACMAVGIAMMVVPLVDNGRLENRLQEDCLVDALRSESAFLSSLGVKVVFESDYEAKVLARFIARLEPALFGINYDIGNSAALGMQPALEIASYGERILNVHIKDRMLGGTTVPLGTGNADFDTVFSALGRIGYAGKYILQTARATDDGHAEVLSGYRDMAADWLARHGA
jgi:L-ribulose-5-phosphate 3-epimerase